MGRNNREFAAHLAENHSVRLTPQERRHAGRVLGKSAVSHKLDAEGTRKLLMALSKEFEGLADPMATKKGE